jgi:ABC-type sugar transport system ATPase subunit
MQPESFAMSTAAPTEWTRASNDDALLVATGIAKQYGRTRALVHASLTLKAGLITGLVGENGSGKSTLVKVLGGITRPDAGFVDIGGQRVNGFSRPADARRRGIATVFQEIMIAPARSVLENVYLGRSVTRRAVRFSAEDRRDAAAVLESLAGEQLDVDMPAECLPISRHQLVTIARALVARPRVLILDEATSALDVSDRDRLFAVCRTLIQAGTSVLFISHRFEELLALADTIVVMRDGETVRQDDASAAPGPLSRDELLAAMARGSETHAQMPSGYAPTNRRRAVADKRGAVLRTEALDLGGGAIDWELDAGAIVGLAGLEGHGQEQFLRALAGLARPTSGTVLRVADAATAQIRSQADASRHRISYLPRSRSRDGIFPSLSVIDNFALPTLERSTTLGFIRSRALSRRYAAAEQMLHIRAASPRALVTTLSGGNQQKVLLARWLAAEPEILLLDDPTRGVDLPTKVELHTLLRRRADAGLAVVIVSTEIEELETLCDSVIVFHEKRVSGRFESDQIESEQILAAMFGQDP